jgi:Carboxypeptidase regulatory-like domain/TonB dependent receptor
MRQARKRLWCELSGISLAAVTLSIWLLAAASPLLAQVITGTIQGHISDTSGASVPKAAVKVTNESTGVSRTGYSADDGYYRVPDLLPATYEIRVELAGFKTLIKSGIEVTTQSTVNLNLTLEVGEVTETVNISAEEAQIETTTARISEVVSEKEVRSLPLPGRGVLNLVTMTPGVTGKSEPGYGCCDVFSNFGVPYITSGPNEKKSNFLLDGMSLRYGEGSEWAATFSPNPDAVTEVRVSTNPTSAEFGLMSGPLVQIVTKGGTNDFHGTGHITLQGDELNAVPFRSTREDIPNSYTRLFGGTLGGPIIKERLFFFGAYEGLREQAASSSIVLTETQAFKDFVVSTRPNSVAAKLFQDFPPFRYPTSGFVDADGDGIPELGEVVLDKANRRTGKQFNARMDYQSLSGQDRIYGSWWYSRPDTLTPGVREAFNNLSYNSGRYIGAQYTHTFSPNALNEARFGYAHHGLVNDYTGNVMHVPELITDDGLYMGNGAFSHQIFPTRTPEFTDIFSLNRGRHGIKIGGTFRHSVIDQDVLLEGDDPQYLFTSMLDFANDHPYQETRDLDAKTGKARPGALNTSGKELTFFVQNTWQVKPNLTFNYGLRWDSYFSNWLGAGRDNWEPILTSSQATAEGISKLINQKVDRFYKTDWNNFGPRVSLAWDPSGQGKMSIRGGFFVLYDEINHQPLYQLATNPPANALVFAGPERGIPIVYGLAPEGTRDFPPNPNLAVPEVSPEGAFVGTRPGLSGVVQDIKSPLTYDMNVGVEYQLFRDWMVFGNYRYRRNNNDLYALNANRYTGDLVDGRLDQLNPYFDQMYILTNLGRRRYHGMVFGANKRFNQGLQLSASYTYNNGKDNYVNSTDNTYIASGTNNFDPSIDWGRDDIAHVFHVHSVWELPILRGKSGWVAGVFGGWQLNTIWNLQSGGFFIPTSSSGFGEGGDFNADGQRGERPDTPTGNVPPSFSKDEWLRGAMSASIFPLPDTVRAGNLPKDFFRRPGYARVDAAFVKGFPIPIGRAERANLQVRFEAFNLFNHINIRGISSSLSSANFGQVTSAYNMRTVQLSLKFIF